MLLKLDVDSSYIGKNIREYLQDLYVGKPIIYKYSTGKALLVNGLPVNSEYKFKKDDKLTILLEDIDKTYFTNERIEILFEDDDYVVVLKPTGLLVHGDSNEIDTLTDRVGNHYKMLNYTHPVLPVHRIDKETSGMVVFAKHFISLANLSHLFELNEVDKVYTAIVENELDRKQGTLKANLKRDIHSNKIILSKSGKEAITHYKVIGIKDGRTLLDIKIDTGRTHQIRVQMASIGYPIVGDELYGVADERLMLHFREISFKHFRTKKVVKFIAKTPFSF